MVYWWSNVSIHGLLIKQRKYRNQPRNQSTLMVNKHATNMLQLRLQHKTTGDISTWSSTVKDLWHQKERPPHMPWNLMNRKEQSPCFPFSNQVKLIAAEENAWKQDKLQPKSWDRTKLGSLLSMQCFWFMT